MWARCVVLACTWDIIDCIGGFEGGAGVFGSDNGFSKGAPCVGAGGDIVLFKDSGYGFSYALAVGKRYVAPGSGSIFLVGASGGLGLDIGL